MTNNYNSNNIKFAKKHRNKQTLGERLLWSRIRNRQLLDTKFKRQVPLLNYVLDFYSPEKRICVEVDGSSHDELRYDKDQKRDNELTNLGIKVLRFSEADVRNRIYEVIQTIVNTLEGIS